MMLARFHPELRSFHHFYADDGPLAELKATDMIEENAMDLEALADYENPPKLTNKKRADLDRDVAAAVKFAMEQRALRTMDNDEGDEADFPDGIDSFEEAIRNQYYKAIADENRSKAEMSIRKI